MEIYYSIELKYHPESILSPSGSISIPIEFDGRYCNIF